jgi:hypothetical protein
MSLFKKHPKFFIAAPIALGVVFGAAGFFSVASHFDGTLSWNDEGCKGDKCSGETLLPPAEPPVIHLKTPEPVKGIYMTACVAATPSWRERLAKLADDTEINTIVIDVKDYTGTIAFDTADKTLTGLSGGGCRVRDMKEFVKNLHARGIYTIARITVFQDPLMSKARPDLAIKKASDHSVVWRDRKGLSFIDPGAKEHWDYIVKIAEESYALGFDELNFDYIRFPSDGDMKDIYFSWSEEELVADKEFGKAKQLRKFFEYLSATLRQKIPEAKLSADLFGMTTTNADDLNIGQVLEYTAPYFDYIAPMVYPSHYPTGFNGWKNVNAHGYDIVKFSLGRAAARLVAASSTPAQLRPWLQDFDYPVEYTTPMVREQIQATYDAGLTSWMMWDAGNKYTPAVYDPK